MTEVALSVLLIANSGYASDLTFPNSKQEQPPAVKVAKKPTGERSILVAKGTIGEEAAKPVVKNRSRRRLEPISNISQFEPELAEPPKRSTGYSAVESAPLSQVVVAPAVETPTVEAPALQEPTAETIVEDSPRGAGDAADETIDEQVAVDEPIANETVGESNEGTFDAELENTEVPADTLADGANEGEASVDEGSAATETEVSEEVAVAGASPLEPVTFHGITPGISVRSEVLSDWSGLINENQNDAILRFNFDGLKSVAVNFTNETVSSIAITLDKPAPESEMIASMQLESVRPVVVADSNKTKFSKLFPERGVVLTLSDAGGMVVATDGGEAQVEPQVSDVRLETINAKSFLQRAKESAKTNLSDTIADLEQVVALERQSADARFLLSCHNLAIGKAVTAERFAAEAVEIEPMNGEFRLQWARCLGRLARYDRAVAEARKVLELPNVEPLHKAAALEEMGQMAALGSEEVSDRAIQLHSKAIEIADKLANHEDAEIRHAAQCILIDAHLAIASLIAQGNFQDKSQAVPQWIERASALTEALIDEDENYLCRRLQVAVSALSAATNLERPINPKLWVEEAEGTVKTLEQQTPDVLTCSQYNWLLGLAYLHAADIEHLRSDAASAKKFGKLAEEKLSELSRQRDELPDTGYTMGRLYFQIGAVYAVHEEDHTAACKWYDQAVDLLLNPVPVTTLAVPQQHGDALVSMGVSYWRIGDRDRAVELTLAGVELIEEAVDAELLSSAALSVPYENLSAMYQALGKSEPAARYQLLARKVSGNLTEAQ